MTARARGIGARRAWTAPHPRSAPLSDPRRLATAVALPIAFASALGVGATERAHAEAATYAIDPTHTFVSFEVVHRGTSISRGRWNRKDGTIHLDRAGRSGRAEITIDMASVSTGVAAFDERLRGPEGFDVARHPSARFVGERFEFDGDRPRRVHGTLALRGRTQPITLEARRFNCYLNPLFKREVCGGDFEASVERSRYGITFGLPALAPDTVRLRVQVEAIRQDETR